jgi:hypothetical protein
VPRIAGANGPSHGLLAASLRQRSQQAEQPLCFQQQELVTVGEDAVEEESVEDSIDFFLFFRVSYANLHDLIVFLFSFEHFYVNEM